MAKKHRKIRKKLSEHLEGGTAYSRLEDLLDIVPFERLGERPEGLPYSFYEQFWHMRLAQHDIIAFTKDPDHTSPQWPEGYWPDKQAPANKKEWEKLKRDFLEERENFREYLLNTDNHLSRPFEHGTGQNLLRESLLILEHNAYHTGQLMLIARLLGVYPEG